MTDTLILKLPGRPEYIGTVRMFFSGIAARAGFSVMQIEDIKTAVSEGCTLLLRTKPENIDIVVDAGKELDITISCDGKHASEDTDADEFSVMLIEAMAKRADITKIDGMVRKVGLFFETERR